MRKLIGIVVASLLLLALPVLADSKQQLTINGQTVEKTVARITFDGDNVLLLFDDNTSQTADMNTVVLTFDYSTISTGIHCLKSPVNDVLDIDGLVPGTTVTVYNAQGKTVASCRAEQARMLLQTSQLKSGVYLLKADRQVVKFIKR